MIAHDPTFESLAQAPVKQSDVIVTRFIISGLEDEGYVEDTSMIWTSSDDLMDVKIDSVGEMLGTVTKKAVVNLLHIQNGVQAGDLFQIRLGLHNGTTFEYISQGYFIVEAVDYNYDKGSTSITLYDHMWEANKRSFALTVGASGLTYPATVEALATEIAQVLDVELMEDFNLLPNADFSMTQDLYTPISTATVQSAIRDIAGATGTTARITDRTLVFSQYEVSSENLDSDNLKTLKIGDTYGPITSVVLGRVPANDNITIFATPPANTVIDTVSPTTNLLTVTAHGMADGNMIRVSSDGSLPDPLQANTNYYIYTNGEADTFALAPTYADAIAGTNLIDITGVGSGNRTLEGMETREIQINNNEILDKNREDLLPALYNVLSGIDWSDVKADTVGLGWHEVGDVIQFTQGSLTVRAFIKEIHLVLAGSVKENLVSTIPDVASINYQAAGGILKTLYNTEILVDKQNQTITSVVAEQQSMDDRITDNSTRITQTKDDVNFTISKSGNGNLLLNSVGFAAEQVADADGTNYPALVNWQYFGMNGATLDPAVAPSLGTSVPYSIATHGTVTSGQSTDSQNYGGISGQYIQMSSPYLASPARGIILTQRVDVAVNTPLSFGVRVRNLFGKGDALIVLSNGNPADTKFVRINDIANFVWAEASAANFTVSRPWIDVTIASNSDSFQFTDLRLMYGTTMQGWVQSNAEILSANVQFNKDGMRIFDSEHDTETQVTYNKFRTVRRTDGVILFEADDTGVVTNDLRIRGATSYDRNGQTVIKQITIPRDNDKAGIAFIKVSE